MTAFVTLATVSDHSLMGSCRNCWCVSGDGTSSGIPLPSLWKPNTFANSTVSFTCNFTHKRSEYMRKVIQLSLLHLQMPSCQWGMQPQPPGSASSTRIWKF